MKRASLILLCLLVFAAPQAFCGGLSFGVGVFGGMDFPILQTDNASGPIYGAQGVLKLSGPISLEPFIYFGSYDAAEFEEFTNDLEGADITAFGLDATFFRPMGKGVGPYLLAGVGYYDIGDDGIATAYESQGSRLGWAGGAGLGIGVTPFLQLDIRGKAHFVTQDGGGSRKSASVTGGLTYYFGVQ